MRLVKKTMRDTHCILGRTLALGPNNASWIIWNHVEFSLASGTRLNFFPYNVREATGLLRLRVAWMPLQNLCSPWVCQQFFPADFSKSFRELCYLPFVKPVNAILQQPVQILFHLEYGGRWAVLTCFSDICSNSLAIPFALIVSYL